MTPYKITGQRAGSRLDQRSLPVRTIVVSFMVGEFGPFEVELDQDKFTPQAVVAAVGELAATVEAVRGTP